MEDKSFALLEKMYVEFSKRFDAVENKVDAVENKVDAVEKKVDTNSNHLLRLENKFDSTSKALFDGYSQTFEKLLQHEDKVDDITARLDGQEAEIKVIRALIDLDVLLHLSYLLKSGNQLSVNLLTAEEHIEWSYPNASFTIERLVHNYGFECFRILCHMQHQIFIALEMPVFRSYLYFTFSHIDYSLLCFNPSTASNALFKNSSAVSFVAVFLNSFFTSREIDPEYSA